MLNHFDAACAALKYLTTAIEELFATHPDAGIITSMPGLAEQERGYWPKSATILPASTPQPG